MLPILAVINTGYWDSPFVFSILTALTIAGFARGFGFGLRLAAAAARGRVPARHWPRRATTASRSAWPPSGPPCSSWWPWSPATGAGSPVRRTVSTPWPSNASGRLADANTLLFSLHRVAQTLPASFDLDEVLDTTLSRLRDLFDCDALAIILMDDTDSQWLVMRRHGVRLPDAIPHEDAPRRPAGGGRHR